MTAATATETKPTGYTAEDIVPAIEAMILRDANNGVLDRYSYIAVCQDVWDALHDAGRISDDNYETIDRGEEVEIGFNTDDGTQLFNVRYMPFEGVDDMTGEDGFTPRDSDDKVVY